MKLGLQLGYWGAQPPTNHAELVATAEEAGSTRCSPPRRGARTPIRRWRGGVVRRRGCGWARRCSSSRRDPTALAMAALTLDHLSGGRHIVGLGVSGPQVVEGWYGAKFPRPLARTREYVDILRQVWAGEAPVRSDGPHYPLPLTGEGTTGLGKNLKPITHPRRADIPVMLGAEGPEERRSGRRDLRRLAAYLLLAESRHVQRVARRGFRATRCATHLGDVRDLCDGAGGRHRRPPAIIELMKPHLALYIGGMGAEDTNFHADVLPPHGLLRGGQRRHEAFPRQPQGRGGQGHPRRVGRRLRDRRRPRLRAGADQGVEAAGVR